MNRGERVYRVTKSGVEPFPDEYKGEMAVFMGRAQWFFAGLGRFGRACDGRQRPGLQQLRVQLAAVTAGPGTCRTDLIKGAGLGRRSP